MTGMPVSPSGRAAGFTLLEMMVVMVLIGVIFSFAMLSMSGDDLSELMERETRRLRHPVEVVTPVPLLRMRTRWIKAPEPGAAPQPGSSTAATLPAVVELAMRSPDV